MIDNDIVRRNSKDAHGPENMFIAPQATPRADDPKDPIGFAEFTNPVTKNPILLKLRASSHHRAIRIGDKQPDPLENIF